MRIRGRTLFWLAAPLPLLLAALWVLCGVVEAGNWSRLLLAVPADAHTGAIATDGVADFCADEFLVAYEIRRPKSARAVQSSHNVTAIGTNSAYRDVLGLAVLDGGYFTSAAEQAGHRQVVLNKAAAFTLFGGTAIAGSTLELDGGIWTVVGVVDDGGEGNRLYLPAAALGGEPRTLLALLGDGVSEIYAETALKELGVQPARFDTLVLSKTVRAFGERLALAWMALALAVMACLARLCISRVRTTLGAWRTRLKERYPRQIVAEHPAQTALLVLSLLLLGGMLGAVVWMGQRGLEIALGWQELSVLAAPFAPDDFPHLLGALRGYQTAGVAVFAVFLLHAACLTAALLLYRRERQ